MFMKILLLFCTVLFSFNNATAQSVSSKDSTDSNLITKLRLVEARKLFYDNNVRGAIEKYREILEENEKNLTATIRMSECYYALKNYKVATKYAEKAWQLSPVYEQDLILVYGKCLHRSEKLNEAIQKFEMFRTNATQAQLIEYDIQKQIDECKLAQLLMKNPLQVATKNFGKQINSKNDDYSPAVTADGKTIYFTSRRDNIENGGRIDQLGDQKYFEDIYYTTFSDSLNEWEKAELIPGKVNTSGHDAVLSVSPDGNSLYVYKNNEESYGDIFISRKSKENNKWREPKPIEKPVNSSFFESSCSITADGRFLYFISERQEGFGQGDIYVCEKITSTEWTKPINIGNVVNTDSDEKFVFITPDGKTLYFASNGHAGMGSYDLFRTEKNSTGTWTIPTNLGYPINSVNEESTFSISSDLSKFYVSAEYKDSEGERDIYQIDIADATTQFKKVTNVYKGNLLFKVSSEDEKDIEKVKVKLIDTGDGHTVEKKSVSSTETAIFSVILGKLYNFEIEAENHKSELGTISIKPNELQNIQAELVNTIVLKIK
jgi:Tol biopolymer transport system component/Tfp pilus assembly protein PilF